MSFWSYLAAWQMACRQAATESSSPPSTTNDSYKASEVQPIAAIA